MVPIGTLATVHRSFGPQIINRYNLYPSGSITGESAAGFSTGRVLEIMETIAESKLPDSMGYDWTGVAYQEKKVAGGSGAGVRDGGTAGLPGTSRAI